MKRSRNITATGAFAIIVLAGAAAALLRFLLGPGEEDLQRQITREKEGREGQRRAG